MAQAFNLTAQLQLQAPGNVDQVVNQIRRQLKPVGIQVNIQNAKNIAQANKSLSSFNKNAQASTKSMNQLNRTLQESARRFSVITIATGSFLALANAFKNSVKEAIAFERELVKISQVTGKTVGQLGSLADEVTRLGTSLGASSSDLLNVARTLAQAGFAAEDTRKALDILAKTSLGATFDDIQDTTEGAIALLRQFKNEARAAGGDIKFLEQSLDAVNAVSKSFAVESADLISAVRRTGGVFAAAGGSVNELIALFTSVRATTRESAETIATGLRTIFTRIQRPETITQLRDMGVELQDAQGNFVGAFEAFKRLSQGLKGLDPRSSAFSQIVEDLGGFRQVGKVIPLIQQFTTAQQALTVAQNASGSVAKDAETAQQSLGVQIQKTREQFDALIRKFVDSSAFRSLATGGLELAKAFIRIADSLEPLLPMLITLAGLKLGRGLAPALGSFVGIGRSSGGAGPITKFASGGMVPGSGNRDTVPAMLTPGEFVIRKASVKKLGASNLAAMNKNKYNAGGSVTKFNESAALTIPSDIKYAKAKKVKFNLSKNRFDAEDEIEINRVPDIKVDVNKYKNRKSPAFNDYRNAVKNNDSKARGLAFERVVSEVNTGIKMAGALGEAQANEDSPTSRIDAFYNGVPREIKSRSKRIADKELGEKVVGGALRPRSDIDSGIQGLLTKQALKKGKDTVDLGSAGLIADVTDLTKINKEATQKITTLGQDVGVRGNEAEDLENKSRRGRPARNFFGGLVQKFAAGGIVGKRAAGAAILDPEAASSKEVNITGEDIKKEFTEFKSLPKGKDPISKYYKSSSFNIAKSGLNKETSNKFKMALEDGLVAGINTSTSALANDLGASSAKIDKSQTSNFVKSINSSIFGRLFETTMDSISRSGQYATPDTDPDRPFDAPGGLPASLKDNFSGLPDSFIDYKSSLTAANDANMKGKVIAQIKRELIQDGILNEKYPRKDFRDKERASSQAKSERERQANEQAGRGFPARRATGGPAPSDNVPALLTPGEFVFNKKAAQSIGYSNLNRMNKQGVQGYAKGGAVGIQRFAGGGESKLQPQGGNFGAGIFDPFIDVMAEAEAQVEKNIQIKKEEERASKEASDSLQELSKDDPQDKLKDLSGRVAETAEKFGRLTQSAQSFVFLASGVVALTAQFSKLEETTKTAINRTATEFASLIGILGTFGDIVVSLILLGNRKIQSDLQEKIASDQATGADLREKVASDQAAAADLREKVASDAVAAADAKRAVGGSIGPLVGGGKTGGVGGAAGRGIGGLLGKAGGAIAKFGSSLLALVGGPLGLLAIAVTAAVVVFRYLSNKQQAEYEKLGKAAQDLTNKFLESGEGLSRTQSALIAASQGDIDRKISKLGRERANVARTIIPGLGPTAPSNIAANEAIDRLDKQVEDLQKNGLRVLTDEIIKTTESFSQMQKSVTAQSEAYDRLTRGILTQEEQNQERKRLLTGADGSLPTSSSLKSESDDILNETINKDLFKDLEKIKEIDIEGALKDPTKAGEEYANTFRLLQIQTKSLGEVQKKAAKNIQESTNLLNSELQKITSSDQINLTDDSSGVGQAFKILKGNIQAEADARKANLQILKELTGDENLKDQYTEQIAAIDKATEERIEAERNNIDNIGVIIDKRADKAKEEIQERKNFLASLRKVQKDRLALESRTRNIEKQADKDQRAFNAERGGLSTDIEATKLTQEFSGAIDAKSVKKEVDAIIEELKNAGASVDELRAASEAATQVKGFADQYENVLNELAGITDPAKITEIVKDSFGSADGDIQKTIIKSLQDTIAAGGTLDFEVVGNALASWVETVDEQRKTLDTASEGNQAAFDANSAALERNRSIIEEEAEGRQKLIDVFNRLEDTATEVDELLASSRGRDTNTEADVATRQSRRQLKVQRDLANAEQNLAANGVKNAKALVGNTSELQKQKQAYQAQIASLAATDKKRKENQASIDDLNKKINALENELDRTANSFTAIDALTGAMNDNIALIEKERNARSQMISVLEQFVVGSEDVRQNLAQAARGVQFAYGTGTLQNQTAEQRQSTVGLLDQLSDVNIAGAFRSAITGEIKEGTGKNIKQELIFRDAIRMGLDPEIAKQLATATTKEEKLIQANEDLAIQINNLSNVMAQSAAIIAGNPAGISDPAIGRSLGGPVQYRANGGSIFQPKGTDTVPAMLTPGEFVIRKSAVDNVGVGALQAINDGAGVVPGFAKGGVVYLDKGGSAEHEDRDHYHQGDTKITRSYNQMKDIRDKKKDRYGIPSSHRDYGKGGLQEENSLDLHMQNFTSSAKTARNIVTGGDLGEGFTDLFGKKFEETVISPAEFAADSLLGSAEFAATEVINIPGNRRLKSQRENNAALMKKIKEDQEAAAREAAQQKRTAGLQAQEERQNDYKSSKDEFFSGLKNKSEEARTEADYNAKQFSSDMSQEEKERSLSIGRYDFGEVGRADLDVISAGYVPGTEERDEEDNIIGGKKLPDAAAGVSNDIRDSARMEVANRDRLEREQQYEEQNAASQKKQLEYEEAEAIRDQNLQKMTDDENAKKAAFDGSIARAEERRFAEDVSSKGFQSGIDTVEKQMENTIPGSEAYNKLKTKRDQLQYSMAQGYTMEEYQARLEQSEKDKKQASRDRVMLGSEDRGTIADRIAVLNEASIGENDLRRKARLEEQIAKLTAQQAGGPSARNTARTRQRARLTPRDERRTFTPRSERGTARQRARAEGTLDVDALRRARGMASRGRSPDGSNMNQRGGFGGSLGGGFMNFLSGYGGRQMGGYGGGYGNQMVPFGFIPGSPYNSMLGRGGYNIPTFDKRMLFGNGAAFFANGGPSGGDTIPAMLTPGEFVMNKGAVSKYGTAFMRNLNKGKVQGFNKGGVVQYRQNGGEALGSSGASPQMMGIDTSKIEGVFDSFVDNISSTFDNLISPLNGVVQSLNQIAQSFGNFTMQHTVNVEGLINVGGLNVETLKNELSKSIGEMVGDEVQRALKDKNNNFKSN